jgi:hypothetical protein
LINSLRCIVIPFRRLFSHASAIVGFTVTEIGRGRDKEMTQCSIGALAEENRRSGEKA